MCSRLFRALFGTLASLLATLPMMVPVTHAQDALALKSRHAQLSSNLAHNQFNRPLRLESSETNGVLKGDIYARIDRPYAALVQALQGTEHWCDILILHLNVKSCRASTANVGEILTMHVGRKFDQPLGDAYAFKFLYKELKREPNYLQVELSATKGPMGTSDYNVTIEAVQLDANRSFLHLSYAYHYGMIANVAMRSYLATGGRSKVGFSTAGRNSDGQPIYLGGVRGVIERNTMRYYLAIEAYLGAPESTPGQIERRLNAWHTDVEQYPLQLHEMDRDTYLAMKHKELARQQAAAANLVAAK
jgi:hypothetical protein